MSSSPANASAESARPPRTAEVLIVGAGPTGLLLAGDMARAGIAVTVLERRTGTSNLTRAFAVHARTLEELDARGVADDLVATGQRVTSVRGFGTAVVDLSRLPSRFPYILVTPQYQTERVLEDRAVKLGAEIVQGAEVIGLRQDDAGVEVEIRGADGAVHTRRAAYLVGSDGVHSTVRHALGLPFPGDSAVRSVMLADVRLTESPPDVLTVDSTGAGFAFVVPFGDGWYRAIAWDRHRELPDDAPVDLDEIRAVAKATLGTDYGMHDARWLSRFHSDERQVPNYRVGRVFLAGDAAHVHSPAGGQGMNTGLQDAANLGWKLAAVLRGHAPESLLDTYNAERHPVGRMVLRGSGALLRVGLTGAAPLRALRGLIGRSAVHLPPVVRRFAGAVSGVAIGYPAPRGAHPLTGKRAPDVRLTGDGPGAPGRLYEALRTGRFVLVTRADAATARAALPGGWPAVVDVVTAPADATAAGTSDATSDGTGGAPTMLVRPDGYIAWATADLNGAAELAAAAERGEFDMITGDFN